jgi:hypothetical protein
MKGYAMYVRSYLHVCKELIRSDLLVFKQLMLDKCIDVGIWVVLTLFVMGYIVMPMFGLPADFGVFQVGGLLAAIGMFEMYGNIVEFVSDITGDCSLGYRFTLPIPSWLVLINKAAYYFIIYCILTVIMFPLCKLCLWNQLDIWQISYIKLSLAIVAQSLFYASFMLFSSSVIDNMSQLSTIWSRFIFPMWFMGGFQFSWMAFYKVFPTMAIISLCNPMIYLTEMTRVAISGQEGYLNFWLCALAAVLFSMFFTVLALHKLKKKLDYV